MFSVVYDCDCPVPRRGTVHTPSAGPEKSVVLPTDAPHRRRRTPPNDSLVLLPTFTTVYIKTKVGGIRRNLLEGRLTLKGPMRVRQRFLFLNRGGK